MPAIMREVLAGWIKLAEIFSECENHAVPHHKRVIASAAAPLPVTRFGDFIAVKHKQKAGFPRPHDFTANA
jgi:hypothetical protein